MSEVRVGARVRVVKALDPSGEAFLQSAGTVTAQAPAGYEEDWEVVLEGDDVATLFFDGELEVL
jgi:hypothetical protein